MRLCWALCALFFSRCAINKEEAGRQVESSTKWNWTDLPQACQNALKTDCGGLVHSLVLGTNGSYFLSYRMKNGNNAYIHNGLPATLTAWLDKRTPKGHTPLSIPNIRIALGPGNNSYWATDGSSSNWWQLPKVLDEYIKEGLKPGGGFKAGRMPRIVLLGLEETYLIINEGGGGKWSNALEQHYPGLYSEIQDLVKASGGKGGSFSNVHSAFIDPHDQGKNYVLQLKNGAIGYNVPGEYTEMWKEIRESVHIQPAAPRAVHIQPAAPRAVPQRRRQGNGTALLGALLGGVAKGLAGANNAASYQAQNNALALQNMAAQNMAFQANMQSQMWDTINAAASMPIQ